eukprot:CAMPEP_0198684066 /NCGR_PEP_ID=MMETSP1468-20131203/11655_1 /TAXON_ID=1461545 /ORGANISM="Mantoniella sp, Strain CCMP1436" /LENGTH=54 /DNA_ID=CAMNT_0044428619 /DNA_START=80 /DNA_END=244 /DNA_ORIENTATION=+
MTYGASKFKVSWISKHVVGRDADGVPPQICWSDDNARLFTHRRKCPQLCGGQKT